MKMVALPSGKQRSIHGPAVNVPSKVDTICNVLPRLPSQSELVPLKLKRKLAYRGHYMYEYITPQKAMNALKCLKAHNPLYAHVELNEQWLEQAMTNDEEFCKHLIEQNEDLMDITCADSAENSSAHSDLSDGEDVFSVALHKLEVLACENGFTVHEVPYDGNCMFSAVITSATDHWCM